MALPAATGPRRAIEQRLVVITEEIRTVRFDALPDLIDPRDVVVVNDAATLPASLFGMLRGEPIEIRLAEAPDAQGRARAILFGAGDWRSKTEERAAPPSIAEHEDVAFGPHHARLSKTTVHPRLVRVEWRTSEAAFETIFDVGKPIQYSYLRGPLDLWDVENVFASRPFAVELPSAARPIKNETIRALRKRGVSVVALTHGAGLSSTGDAALDAMLPLPERYDIPNDTIAAIHMARVNGGRVIAVGTSVVRAIEGCAAQNSGELVSGPGETDLRIDHLHTRRFVSGLLTGMHEPTESHYALLSAFAARDVLDRTLALAAERGFLSHEFGDSCLILSRQE